MQIDTIWLERDLWFAATIFAQRFAIAKCPLFASNLEHRVKVLALRRQWRIQFVYDGNFWLMIANAKEPRWAARVQPGALKAILTVESVPKTCMIIGTAQASKKWRRIGGIRTRERHSRALRPNFGLVCFVHRRWVRVDLAIEQCLISEECPCTGKSQMDKAMAKRMQPKFRWGSHTN